MSQEELAEYLTNEIRNQDPLHSDLLRDLAKLASSPGVNEEDFHSTFLKVVTHSGIETRLQNAVFHLMRRKIFGLGGLHNHLNPRQTSLSHINKFQVGIGMQIRQQKKLTKAQLRFHYPLATMGATDK